LIADRVLRRSLSWLSHLGAALPVLGKIPTLSAEPSAPERHPAVRRALSAPSSAQRMEKHENPRFRRTLAVPHLPRACVSAASAHRMRIALFLGPSDRRTLTRRAAPIYVENGNFTGYDNELLRIEQAGVPAAWGLGGVVGGVVEKKKKKGGKRGKG